LLDVDVSLGDDVELSAYGLNANLTGDMRIRQKSPNPPQLGGEIAVVDGIYKQYGQNLEANGQILFVGPVNQTRLAIDAVRKIEAEDRVAGLRIQGTVESPEIVLFTEPADKPQDSILSYIVLGRDINETSDQEANLLATAALALTVRGGRSIAGGVASALGVQDFAFETRGKGDDTELIVSGRLNDRLLLRYGRSVFEPLSTLYLRYDLTKKLYLEAAQSSLEQAVDLFYSFSF
jgi:translocation and assembly module TamB